MAALIVDLRPVRNAVEQSKRMGMPESRRDVVARVVADIKAGGHPFRTAQQLQAHRLTQPQGSAA